VNEIRLTAAWVAEAMRAAGSRLAAGDPGQEFGGVSIDTRTIAAGELFIAIRGERFDGAEFAAAALDRGAAGIVVPHGWATRAGGHGTEREARGWEREAPRTEREASAERHGVIVEVDDTTAALQELARAIRRESGTKIVAITGSAGKTTTKELTAELLAAKFRVIRNRGNFNNHIGLPLSLIELRRRPDVAVVELGMNHAGEIRTLVGIAEPECRVWTNVGEAHLGFFSSVEAIADAKAEILEGASAATVLVANADDDRIVARLPRFSGRVVTFGIDRNADVRAVAVEDLGLAGTRSTVRTPAGEIALGVPLVGRGNLSNALAAIAVALEFGVPLDATAARIALARPAAHRGEVVRLAGGVTVIDDSYNANPTATKRAIEVLAGSTAGRRIAVLGEMLELGDRSERLHADVGRAVAQQGVDVLMTIGGPAAEAMSLGAADAGMPEDRVRHVKTSDEAAEAIAAMVKSGDLVLVKGSRGIRTDRVVDRLRSERG
jgi:UDP-N-acetylmuramoyl-tripeptide--D-alanyl-D-alanine ligase